MQTIYWNLQADNETEILKAAGCLLRQGEVVAFPTETVYGLGADGLNGTAVAKIFAAKGRPVDNPLILHIASVEDILPLTSGLTANARALMQSFWPGPLTLIVAKSDLIPDEVSAGLDTVGVRMPSHPIAARLIKETGRPIAAPSANISGKPSPTDASAVWDDMQGKIAGVIDGGSCGIGVESTVVDTTSAVPMILRPGGITREMLEEVLGAVEIDPALEGKGDFKPKAPGMKYRHYAPQAAMYLFEGEAISNMLPIDYGHNLITCRLTKSVHYCQPQTVFTDTLSKNHLYILFIETTQQTIKLFCKAFNILPPRAYQDIFSFRNMNSNFFTA